MLRRNLFWPVAALAAAAHQLNGEDAYQSAIEEWRKDYDRNLRSDKGPLYLIARHTLSEGTAAIGSHASSTIELPHRAPKRVGSLELRGGKLIFAPNPGLTATLNGKPLTAPATLRTSAPPDPNDKIAFGDFEIAATIVDGTCQLIVRDRQSSFLKSFHGSAWFPVNPVYRVEGVFEPYPQPKELKIPDTSGRTRTRRAPGSVVFQLNGEVRRLEPIEFPAELFFMFKDRTSARETYGAGRFLESEMPKNGKVVLDFNKAYNPYCAINPYSSCPIPQKYNTLATRVEAGEKYRNDH